MKEVKGDGEGGEGGGGGGYARVSFRQKLQVEQDEVPQLNKALV
jgi:hypothetical protein